MAARYWLFCVSTLFVQDILCQTICNAGIFGQNTGALTGVTSSGYPIGITGGVIDSGLGGAVIGSGSNVIGTNDNGLFAYGTGPNDFVLGNGVDVSYCGTFGVSSSSSLAPNGIQVVSNNVLEGPVTVAGQLPFLGAVALGGTMTSGGIGGVSYGSGYSNVGILNQIGSQVGATGLDLSGSNSGISTGLGSGIGIGTGYGSGIGTGFGSGIGVGYGSGVGTSTGYGSGMGVGFGSGIGTSSGYSSGMGVGFGSGIGTSTGYGSGMGVGFGSGVGTGTGYSSVMGSGSGSGTGIGFGSVTGSGLGTDGGFGIGVDSANTAINVDNTNIIYT